MMPATEEAPMKVTLSAPSKPYPVTIENETITSSGIRISTRNTTSPTVTVKFTLLGGSSAELPSERGAALMLKSTALSAGTGKRSGIRLCRDLENVGARVTTAADRQKISLTVTALADKVEAAVQAVAEAIVSPPSNPFAILELKDAAMVSYEDLSSPASVVEELLHEAAYGEETPLGSPFLPSKREFKALSAEAVLAFRARTYASSNLIVTASGISAANLKVLLESHLHGLPKGGEKALSLPPSPYMGGDVKVKADLEGKTVLGLGFNVAGAKGAELLVQSLITAKLGKSHHVTSFCHTYVSSTLLGFVVEGQSPAAASAALEAIVAELKSMASSSADSKSLESFRKHLSLSRASAFNSPSYPNAALSDAIAGGVTGADEAAVGSLMKLPLSAVSEAAKSMLASTPSYALYGRTAGTVSYQSLLKMLK